MLISVACAAVARTLIDDPSLPAPPTLTQLLAHALLLHDVLGYDALSAIYPGLIFVSVSGFGNLGESPYAAWPAYAMVPEAMSGI